MIPPTARRKRPQHDVAGGGRLVVQYNTAESGLQNRLGPLPFQISRERVTVEEAPVELKLPDHPLLATPNRIGPADFDGWIQERGLYFASPFDKGYDAPLSSHDPGEPARDGGLLYARHGKGAFIYAGYAFFRQLPRDLEEAALMDGASRLRAAVEVMLPLSAPAVATTAILTFLYAWNEFLFALSFTLGPDRQTVPVAIALFRGQYQVPWGQILAAAVVASIPVAVVVLLFQRRIVSGLTSGATKGSRRDGRDGAGSSMTLSACIKMGGKEKVSGLD